MEAISTDGRRHDVDEIIERFHLAQGEFVKGNTEPVRSSVLPSESPDPVGNPLALPPHGWEQVAAAIERAASRFRDGELVSAEIIEKHATPELAYVVEIERGEAKIGGREEITPWVLEGHDDLSTRRR